MIHNISNIQLGFKNKDTIQLPDRYRSIILHSKQYSHCSTVHDVILAQLSPIQWSYTSDCLYSLPNVILPVFLKRNFFGGKCFKVYNLITLGIYFYYELISSHIEKYTLNFQHDKQNFQFCTLDTENLTQAQPINQKMETLNQVLCHTNN